MKEHNQVKQDYATVKTTNETGVRKVDHLTQTFNTTGEVATAVVALFVGITALFNS